MEQLLFSLICNSMVCFKLFLLITKNIITFQYHLVINLKGNSNFLNTKNHHSLPMMIIADPPPPECQEEGEFIISLYHFDRGYIM